MSDVFELGDILFLMMDFEESDYYNTSKRRTGGISPIQYNYFKNVLEKYPEVNRMVF
ncbi:hypothetical protein [Psychroserpens sp.]|uniref:hypothetical protein n=1 Tax=Psychroserpens sp. TaxID=2020870 RepID=UPI0030032075